MLFTVSFYHFLFSRYLGLAKRRFSSDVLVPFPDSSDLYSRVKLVMLVMDNLLLISTIYVASQFSSYVCEVVLGIFWPRGPKITFARGFTSRFVLELTAGTASQNNYLCWWLNSIGERNISQLLWLEMTLFRQKSIAWNIKTFITQLKHMLFCQNKKFLKAYNLVLLFLRKINVFYFGRGSWHGDPFLLQSWAEKW